MASKKVPPWRKALANHHNILEKHLKLWTSILEDPASDARLTATARTAISQTRSMITACGELNSSLDVQPNGDGKSKNKRKQEEPEPERTSKKQRRKASRSNDSTAVTSPSNRSPVVKDPSGLFVVDSNPTNVDNLLNGAGAQLKSEAQKKRRRSDQDDIQPGRPITATPLSDRSKKRKKIDHKQDNPAQQIIKSELDEDEAYHQEFEAKVALRLKEKEKQRKKKGKKRKSDSGVSTASGDTEDDDTIMKTKKKAEWPKKLLKEEFDLARKIQTNLSWGEFRKRL